MRFCPSIRWVNYFTMFRQVMEGKFFSKCTGNKYIVIYGTLSRLIYDFGLWPIRGDEIQFTFLSFVIANKCLV
jgi:hypothetical protein